MVAMKTLSKSLASLWPSKKDIRSKERAEVYEDLPTVSAFDFQKLKFGPQLTCTSTGRLFVGSYGSKSVVIKVLTHSKGIPTGDCQKCFNREVSVLSTLKHANIVEFIGCYKNDSLMVLVTAHATGGSVYNYLRNSKSPLPVKRIIDMALDVACGMEYLHSHDIVHRDLKSENLVINRQGTVQIVDFGVSRCMTSNEEMTVGTGTYRWMAPEVLEKDTYNSKVDVYSYGIVLWELFCRREPYTEMPPLQAAFAVVTQGLRPSIPADCPEFMADLMKRCWQKEPSGRPSFSEIVADLKEFQAGL